MDNMTCDDELSLATGVWSRDSEGRWELGLRTVEARLEPSGVCPEDPCWSRPPSDRSFPFTPWLPFKPPNKGAGPASRSPKLQVSAATTFNVTLDSVAVESPVSSSALGLVGIVAKDAGAFLPEASVSGLPTPPAKVTSTVAVLAAEDETSPVMRLDIAAGLAKMESRWATLGFLLAVPRVLRRLCLEDKTRPVRKLELFTLVFPSPSSPASAFKV